jgi:hypothetical protein
MPAVFTRCSRASVASRITAFAFVLRAFVAAASALGLCAPVCGGAEIEPPFGLRWSGSRAQIEELVHGAKARVTETRTLGERDAFTVQGLDQPGLWQAVFYFTANSLSEVELQYQSADWDAPRYADFVRRVKDGIEQRYGPGKLVAHSNNAERDVMQSMLCYRWSQQHSALHLVFFAAERGAQSFRLASIHYKRE